MGKFTQKEQSSNSQASLLKKSQKKRVILEKEVEVQVQQDQFLKALFQVLHQDCGII